MSTFNLTPKEYEEYQKLMGLPLSKRTEKTEERLEQLLNKIEDKPCTPTP